MSNDRELTRENLEEVREYRNVEWDEDELTRFHDFLEESGLATRLRQPDSIDQVLADIFPAPVDNSEGHGRDRIAHLMDCMIELVEDVVRDHMGVSNRSPAVAAAAAAAAAAAEAAIQVGPSTSSSWPAGAEVAAAAEQSDDILEAISSVSPGMPSMDDFIDTAASLPATPRGALYSPPLPEREPTVDLNNSSLMEAIDRYDRSLDQLAAEANSQPSSSTTQSDPLLSSPPANSSTTTDDSQQQRRTRFNYFSSMELSPLISSVACSSTTSDNRDSYLNVGRGEATPSSSGNRQRLGQATPSPSSCKPPAATSSSSGRRRKATEYTPSTDMGGMCLDTPTTSKKRRMLRRQRVGVTTRVPPFMPTPSRSPWTSSTRSTPSTRNDAVPPHVSPGVAAAAARSLAPRALVWSYQEDDHPLALDGDAAAAAADADAAAVAAEEASASRQVPDTTTSEQRDDNEHPDAPKSRWAELISAMKGSQVMRGLTRLAAELRARLGIDFSVNETMDKVVKQIKLKALLTTVYRFFHEENSSMKDLFEEYFEPRKQK